MECVYPEHFGSSDHVGGNDGILALAAKPAAPYGKSLASIVILEYSAKRKPFHLGVILRGQGF